LRRQLIEYAKTEALLDSKEPDGASKRTHLQRAAQAGFVDALLDKPELPLLLRVLWEHFLALNRTRQAGMGANPLTYTEIDAYCRLNRIDFTPWELDCLLDIDTALLSVWKDSKHTFTEKKS
jgi:hypothetical protein